MAAMAIARAYGDVTRCQHELLMPALACSRSIRGCLLEIHLRALALTLTLRRSTALLVTSSDITPVRFLGLAGPMRSMRRRTCGSSASLGLSPRPAIRSRGLGRGLPDPSSYARDSFLMSPMRVIRRRLSKGSWSLYRIWAHELHSLAVDFLVEGICSRCPTLAMPSASLVRLLQGDLPTTPSMLVAPILITAGI